MTRSQDHSSPATSRNSSGMAEALPPADTRRWVAGRKAQVVGAVHRGVLTLEEACARYSLSVEEFLAWQRAFTTQGVRGLRATRTKDSRSLPRPAE
jgi:hypothetical protein